jgi:hypothetical protein
MNERYDNPADDEDDSQPDVHNTDRRVGQAETLNAIKKVKDVKGDVVFQMEPDLAKALRREGARTYEAPNGQTYELIDSTGAGLCVECI